MFRKLMAGVTLAAGVTGAAMSIGSGVAVANDEIFVPLPPAPIIADTATVPNASIGKPPVVSVPGHWDGL